jgi:tripartite motif-containing protein 71
LQDGQFINPAGIAVDSSGYVYVADAGNNRVQKFDSNGTFVTKWDFEGKGDGQFELPTTIAVDSSCYIYVTEINNDRVQKFDNNGKFITKWGSAGNGDGQFNALEV